MQNTIDPSEQNIEDCVMFLAGEGNFIFQENVSIDKFDLSIVKSLGSQLGQGNAFTQKQSLIGLRLVNKYSKLLEEKGFEVEKILQDKVFKWPFRTIDRTKSLYVDGESIVIKSPFIADIVNKIKKRKCKSYDKGMYQSENKTWSFDYNEGNVEFLVNLVRGFNFNIDDKIKEDFDKVIGLKKNPIDHYPMLTRKMGGYVYNDIVIEQEDPRRAVMKARLQGCTVFDDSVVESMKPSKPLDKVLLGDSRKWYINSSVHHILEIFSLLNTVDKCIIMCSGDSLESLQNIVENLFGSGYNADDISVMFRFKNNKEWFEGNKYIKNAGVNKFDPNKKIFIINEKIPKPLISSNIDPQLIISTLATQPSHYKTQAWLDHKPNVLYYAASKPSGVENCADV
jgi:hypothetical protein